MYPRSYKDFNSESNEKAVYEALDKCLPREYNVFHSFKQIQVKNNIFVENECDFIIYHKDKGILCIEVKNIKEIECTEENIWKVKNKEGKWEIMKHGGPYAQAEIEKAHLYSYIRSNKNTSDILKRCNINFAVWFLQQSKDDIADKGWPASADPAITLYAEDLKNPKKRIDELLAIKHETYYKDNVTGAVTTYPMVETKPNPGDDDLLFKHVFKKKFNLIETGKLDDITREKESLQLLDEQTFVLDFIEDQKTVAINGAAGTGKTLVAEEKARRLAEEGDTVLFLCFNSLLRDYLDKKNESFNKFCKGNNGGSITFRTMSDFIKTDVLKENGKRLLKTDDYDKAVEVLTNLYGNEDEKLPYKHVIIDEGQDFSEQVEQYESILDLLFELISSYVDDSCFYIFYDEYQRVNGNHKYELPSYIKNSETQVSLKTNCRNTRNIALVSLRPIITSMVKTKRKQYEEELKNSKLSDAEKQRLINTKETLFTKRLERRQKNIHGVGDGFKPQMYFCEYSKDAIISRLEKEIGRFIGQQISPKEITILTCMSETTTKFSEEFRNRTIKIKNYDITFHNTNVFKGLESKVVILIEVLSRTFTEYPMSFYVGASRAKEHLSVIASISENEAKELTSWFSTPPIGPSYNRLALGLNCEYKQ